MSGPDDFQVSIVGTADEATRFAFVAELDALAERYTESISQFTVFGIAKPATANLRRLTAAEVEANLEAAGDVEQTEGDDD